MRQRLVFAIPGDIERRTGGYGYDRRLAAALRDAGRDVEILRLEGGFPDPSPAESAAALAAFEALPDGTPVLVDGLAGGVLPQAFEAGARRLRMVALCHHPLALETGVPAGRASTLAALERRGLSAARAVLVTSLTTAETLAADFGVRPDQVTVAVPGTDRRPAAPCAGRPPVLLTVASLIPRKGHDTLISALAMLPDLDWSSSLVGGDDHDPAWTAHLRSLVAAAGLGDRVHFVGEVDDPADAFAGADLFVLPSRYEGYGMVFAEALAFGLPVIAARAGAVSGVVPADAGRLVPPDDAAALAAAIRELLTDKRARADARAAARRAGLALPGWDDTARIVDDLLDRVATPEPVADRKVAR